MREKNIEEKGGVWKGIEWFRIRNVSFYIFFLSHLNSIEAIWFETEIKPGGFFYF
jgi:hypothetical protein